VRRKKSKPGKRLAKKSAPVKRPAKKSAPVKRPAKKDPPVPVKYLTREQQNKMFRRQRTEREDALALENQRRVIKKFKPKKKDFGKIAFITRDGKHGEKTSRVGYVVYVDKKGKKSVVRQYQRKSKKLEKVARPKKITAVDVSRVRSKKAQRVFFAAKTNPIAQGKIENSKTEKLKPGELGTLPNGTRFKGGFKARAFYQDSKAVDTVAKELFKAVKTTLGKRDYLVSIGLTVSAENGETWFIKTERRFARREKQRIDLNEMKQFIGLEIYRFLARQLVELGLVLQGSAGAISRLPDNIGKERDGWEKDGFLWEGHDLRDVRIHNVEYRFDQLSFGK
jgi:hypothetical protein